MLNLRSQITLIALVSLVISGCNREDSRGSEAAKGESNLPQSAIVEPGEPIEINQSNEIPVGESERELLIGIVGPETGPEAEYGEAVYLGAELAVDTINNDGGINGQELQLLHYDNQSDAGQTSEIVKYLIHKKSIAILSAPTGWATFGPTHLTNDSDTILISVGSRRNISRSGDYTFQLSLGDDSAADHMIEYSLKNSGLKRFALVTVSDYDYSLDISSSFKKALDRHDGKLILEVDTYDTFTGQHNIDAVITGIVDRADALDAVIFTGNINEAAQLLKSLRQNDIALPLIGGEDLFSDEFLNKAGDAALGSLVYATYPNRSLNQTLDFISGYEKRNENTPDRFAALSFDAVMLVANAISTSGSRHSSVVRDALLESKVNDGVTGKLAFTEQGTSQQIPLIYKVVAGKGARQFALQK